MNCEHINKRMRIMRHCGQVKFQCMDCGRSVGDAMSHKQLASEGIDANALEDFDMNFRSEQHKKAMEFNAKARDEKWAEKTEEMTARKESYYQYLDTEEWREKRRMVIQRERNLCQGCMAAPIEQVHHLTYSNVMDELLFQLIGLCRACHKKSHHIESSCS